MLRSTSSLVHRRGLVYWFRKSVPVDLIDRLGSSDLRRSLRTCNGRVARQRAWTLILLVEDAFAVLRAEGLSPNARSVLDAIINRVINDFDQGNRAWADRAKYGLLLDSLNSAPGAPAAEELPSLIAEDVPDRVAPVASMTNGQHQHHAVGANIHDVGILRAVTAVDLEAVAQAVAKAVQQGNVHAEARKPLTAHVEGFVADLRRKKRSSQYLSEIGTKLRIFVSTMGDKPVFAYTKLDLLAYRDLIDQMPFDAIKHLKTDDPSTAIALNAQRPVPLPPISPTTVNAKYLSAVRGVFDYLIRKGFLDSNPAANVCSEQEADGEDLLDAEVRLPFTPDMERAIFELTGKKPKFSADYWWPRFNVRQGLRLQEFTQLCVSDFRELHGRFCVDLLHFNFDGDECHQVRREELRLKSAAARRIWPVAQALLDDGLTALIEKRRREGGANARLFPKERPDRFGNTSAALSKRANRVVRQVTEDPRYVAYSARHSFAQRCDDAGVPLAVRNMFMGHEPPYGDKEAAKKLRGNHVSSRYGSPLPTAEELAWFDKIDFS
ncbi:MAG: integrase family protein [Devosia sp.]|nr:integrase family protein [Devosia sp.]